MDKITDFLIKLTFKQVSTIIIYLSKRYNIRCNSIAEIAQAVEDYCCDGIEELQEALA